MKPTAEGRRGGPVNIWKAGTGNTYKGENSTMKNVSIESSGGEKIYFWAQENCVFAEKFLYL